MWKTHTLALLVFAFGATQRVDDGKDSELRPQIVDQPAATVVPASPWADKLFLGIVFHDFGVVPAGTRPTHRFSLKNIYATPIRITDIRHSCGCVMVCSSHSGQKPIAPDEEGWIDVTFDGGRAGSAKRVVLYVTFGPDFVSTTALEVTADVRAD